MLNQFSALSLEGRTPLLRIRNAQNEENTSKPKRRKDGYTHLKIYPHDNSKLVEIWLTKEDQADQALQAWLQEQYRDYAKKKYTVVVFRSGNQDLVEETSALLRYNRRRSAEREVQRKKVRRERDCR